MEVNLRARYQKLNHFCRGALDMAGDLCLAQTHYRIDVHHYLSALLEGANTDIASILRFFQVDYSRVSQALTAAMDRLKRGNTEDPAFSPRMVEWLESAWLVASLDQAASQIRSGHLLWALLEQEDLQRLAFELAPPLREISVERLAREFSSITEDSSEAKTATPLESPTGAPGAATTGGQTQALDQFTVDLTARARAGEIDPILGRDAEIRLVVDILTRRRQNNPILTGEAGVGKTAVVEGFARRIAEGDVPEPLKNVALRTLDLGLLQAGAGVKGEFENRLKSVIEEVKASPQPIILFIDEAHTMIGAGGQAGQNDAANLLKPALARGELRTIAATTWAEYKKYFEKDPALARRFQVIKVEEPSEQQAIIMMRALTDVLEQHHQVKILDEAVEEAVKISARYITGRQLPDKCVSVLDTACARVAIGQGATPALVEDAQRRITNLTREIEVLQRELLTGVRHEDRIKERQVTKAQEEEKLGRLQHQWKQEQEKIQQIREIRNQIEHFAIPTTNGTPEKPSSPSGELEGLQHKLEQLNKELTTIQGETPLMQPCVSAQTVAEVISGWTGIPVGKMLTNEIQTVLTLREHLEQRVRGQSHALEAISQRIRTSRANLIDPRRPIGVFLLVGPSGVGKTETALTLAEKLYGGERNLITINMSEFQEAHTVSTLKGSPPGYVGYGEGGVLTEAVRRKPYSVVLFDEVEKAHPDVMELFYQVFDKGMLEDGEGRDIDFKNTVILLTSNVATDTIMKLCADPDTRPEPEGLEDAIRPELQKVFKPALLGRMVVVPYYPLGDTVMKDIIALQLGRIGQRLVDHHGAKWSYDDLVIAEIVRRCTDVDSGARNVDHILTRSLLPDLSGQCLARMAQGEAINRVHVGIGESGQFTYQIA